MHKTFKPSWRSFFIRLLWAMWPMVLVVLCVANGIIDVNEPHAEFYPRAAWVMFWAVFGWALFLKARYFTITNDSLIVKQWLLPERKYAWSAILHPLLSTHHNRLVPHQQIFTAGDAEGASITIWLSDLSETDRLESIDWLEIKLSNRLKYYKQGQ